MPRKPRKLPDYFTMEEAAKLVQATESSDARMAMRLMLRCGLRVSEALAVRPSQLRFDRSPPIISLPADIVGNKAKTAREIPHPRGPGGDTQGPRLGRDQGPQPAAGRTLPPGGGTGNEEGCGGGGC